MIGTAALIVSGYAGYAGWPWWLATLLGAAAGIWNFGVRAGAMPDLMDRSATSGNMLLQGTVAAIAIFGAVCSGVYFLTRWLSGGLTIPKRAATTRWIIRKVLMAWSLAARLPPAPCPNAWRWARN